MSKFIDREYSTQDRKEMFYLIDNGCKYEFAKTYNGVTTWKFTKSKRLFELLVKYYSGKEIK